MKSPPSQVQAASGRTSSAAGIPRGRSSCASDEHELSGEVLVAASDDFDDDNTAGGEHTEEGGGAGGPSTTTTATGASLSEDPILAEAIDLAIQFGEAKADSFRAAAAAAEEERRSRSLSRGRTAPGGGGGARASAEPTRGEKLRADSLAAENVRAFRALRTQGGRGDRYPPPAEAAEDNDRAASPPSTTKIRQRYKPHPSAAGAATTAIDADLLASELVRLRERLERSEAKCVELNITLRAEMLARRRAESALDEEDEWNGYLARLLRYREENNGDTHVPRRYEDGDSKGSLGRWVSNLRRLRREREAGDNDDNNSKRKKAAADRYLKERRIELLDAIRFSWSGKKTITMGEIAEISGLTPDQIRQQKREEYQRRKKELVKREEEQEWNSYFCKLAQYHSEKGNCDVPSTHGGGRKGSLGYWVKRMRQLRRERESGLGDGGCLTEDRINILDTLSFRWNPTGGTGSLGPRVRSSKKDERPWDDMFAELLAYREEKGDCNVSMTYGGGQIGSLGHWCRLQKMRKRRREMGRTPDDGLTDEQIQRLSDVGFVWSVPRDDPKQKFEDRIKELLEYKAVHGHVCPPTEKSTLGKWVHYQRGRYRERQNRAKYVEEHGTDAGYKRRGATMSQEEVDRLNEIGFVWLCKTVPDLGWDAQYEELLAYKAEHGHCDVPQSYKGKRTLGRWVMRQRVLYGHKKIGKLKSTSQIMSDERIAKLEAIGFKWSKAGVKRKRGEDQQSEEDEESSDSDPDDGEEQQYEPTQYHQTNEPTQQYQQYQQTNQHVSTQYGSNVGNFVM